MLQHRGLSHIVTIHHLGGKALIHLSALMRPIEEAKPGNEFQERVMLATGGCHSGEYSRARHPRQPSSQVDMLALMDQVPGGSSRTMAARQHVYFEGDSTTHVYFIEAGAISIYKLLADGRRQIIDFAMAGDIIGLGSSGEHRYSAQATTITKLRLLPCRSLYRVARDCPAVAMQLYRVLSQELAAARTLLVTLGQRSAVQRVAAFLLALSGRNERLGKDPGSIELPMTRADIADFLGLTIETISRSITKLKVRGLVTLGEAGQIELVDIASLDAVLRSHEGPL